MYPRSSAAEAAAQNTVVIGEKETGSETPRSAAVRRAGLSLGLDGESTTGRHITSPAVKSIQPTVGNSPASLSSTNVTETLHIGNPASNTVTQPHQEPPSFSSLGLLCPINVDAISIRWMNSYIASPGQTIKAYRATTVTFIYRMLKSYVSGAVRGRGAPPFIHLSQITPTSSSLPIATCLSLVRICDSSLPRSNDIAFDVLTREMNMLYECYATYDDIGSLSAFQAYLIYSMVLVFHLDKGTDPFLRQAVVALQEIACASSRRGLLCQAEQERSRPSWDAWIVAEAKRRTLYTMYLFDNMLSAQDGLPTFLGTELQGLPAPSSKTLWQAGGQYEWETAYNLHLADWAEDCLHIDELWAIPPGLDETGVTKRRSRVDQWLENVDEFGIMVYAVTSCTHGG